jgi:hypothetical protein
VLSVVATVLCDSGDNSNSSSFISSYQWLEAAAVMIVVVVAVAHGLAVVGVAVVLIVVAVVKLCLYLN